MALLRMIFMFFLKWEYVFQVTWFCVLFFLELYVLLYVMKLLEVSEGYTW